MLPLRSKTPLYLKFTILKTFETCKSLLNNEPTLKYRNKIFLSLK